MIPIAILMKLYDLDSRFEKNPLEMTKRFGEHQALDYAHVYRRWEAGELFPGETLIRPKKWWQVMKKSEVIQLPGKQLSRRAFDKWYKKRLELQKLLNVTGGAGEEDIWRIPLKRHLDFYQMLHLLNEQYAMFYRAVIQYQVGEVELSPFVVGPSAIYIMEWLDGDESIYHIRRDKLWREQPFKASAKQILNPNIGLKRTEDILRVVLGRDYVLPIERVILAPSGYFDQIPKETTTTYVNKVDFPKWLNRMNGNATHTKAAQMRVCEKILKETVSIPFQMAIQSEEQSRIQE